MDNDDLIKIANEFRADLKEKLRDNEYMKEYIAEAIRLYSEDGCIPLLIATLEPIRAACHNERWNNEFYTLL